MTFLFVCLFIRNYHKKANKRSHSADTTSITEMKFNWKRVWIFAWVMSILANGEQYTNCLLFFFLWNLRWNSNEYQCAMCAYTSMQLHFVQQVIFVFCLIWSTHIIWVIYTNTRTTLRLCTSNEIMEKINCFSIDSMYFFFEWQQIN